MEQQTPSSETFGTRDRLLDAAEELYAEHGIDGTSLRSITRRADANLAAVHYHFGSKASLTEAVFSRRIVPLNQERLELLEAVEKEAQRSGVVSLESILRAFLLPVLKCSRDPSCGGEKFVRLMGRMYSEPKDFAKQLVPRYFEVVARRFISALAKTLTQLSPEELSWRFHFMVGSMVHTVAGPAKWLQLHSGSAVDDEALSEFLVTFLAAGLRAPPASEHLAQEQIR